MAFLSQPLGSDAASEAFGTTLGPGSAAFVPADADHFCSHCGFPLRPSRTRSRVYCREYALPGHGRCGRRYQDAQSNDGLRRRLDATQRAHPYDRRTNEDAVAHAWVRQHRPEFDLGPWQAGQAPSRVFASKAAAVQSGESTTTQLAWKREEVILAMDLYTTAGCHHGDPIPGQTSSEVAHLSGLLKKLSAYPPAVQGEKYRNANGVYLKLVNLRAIQTEGAHGMNAYSQTDAAVWREYVDDLRRLHAEAAAIRSRLLEGAITPAKSVPVVEDVEIEQQHTERFMVSPSGEPRRAERAEQALVLRYRAYMAAKGIAVCRKKYLPQGEVRPIYSDVWVKERNALIEAKNSDSRDALRQAIGQLYDYRRFHEAPLRLAVLLPYQPGAERLELLRSADVEAIWPHGSAFRDSAHGVFI